MPAQNARQVQQEPKYSIVSLEKTTHDARQVQIVWTGGTLGLLKIDYDGSVERVVVYGSTVPSQSQIQDDGSSGEAEHRRLHGIERLLMRSGSGERVHIQDLAARLQIVEKEL